MQQSCGTKAATFKFLFRLRNKGVKHAKTALDALRCAYLDVEASLCTSFDEHCSEFTSFCFSFFCRDLPATKKEREKRVTKMQNYLLAKLRMVGTTKYITTNFHLHINNYRLHAFVSKCTRMWSG